MEFQLFIHPVIAALFNQLFDKKINPLAAQFKLKTIDKHKRPTAHILSPLTSSFVNLISIVFLLDLCSETE